MKYGIVGSRRRHDRKSVIDFVNSLDTGDEIVSGGCLGVDTWAIDAAIARNLATMVFKPHFDGCNNYYSKCSAYYARNKQIAEACDVLVAFVAPSRKGGTENTIKHAKKLKKRVIIL